ncbi:MAG: Uma2 family endonuclease [Isosphaeraceae bacterium]|nr:Uma2 family endonuclease [Isosphaeraceae bacterium]
MSPTSLAIPSRVSPRSAGILLTPEEFDALPMAAFDDRYRYELIRGVLIVTPPPGSAERGPNDELGHWLRIYRETHPQGAALDETLPEQTVPTTANRRRCDRAIWAGLGQIPDDKKDLPTIVVEFVSAWRRDRQRDYQEKRQEYMAVGVREYWIIDRFRRIMTVHRNDPGGVVTREVKESESYQTDLLPGFVLPLGQLLAKADLWSRKHRGRKSARGGQ